jgi:hypothetical protein
MQPCPVWKCQSEKDGNNVDISSCSCEETQLVHKVSCVAERSVRYEFNVNYASSSSSSATLTTQKLLHYEIFKNSKIDDVLVTWVDAAFVSDVWIRFNGKEYELTRKLEYETCWSGGDAPKQPRAFTERKISV